jgi:hypothetical protein
MTKKQVKKQMDKQEDAIDAVVQSNFVGKTHSQEILALLREIKEQNIVLKRRMTWMVVGNYLRLLLVILPLIIGTILAYVYLPSFMQDTLGQYEALFSGGVGSSFSVTDLLQQVSPEQIQEARNLLNQ